MRVADYLIKALFDKGVRHVFTVTGRGALFLTDALAAKSGLTTVCTHHEQAAAFAANAYADSGEKLGVCLVSTGCAATNTLTGVLNAWQDSLPVIYISGQNKLKETSQFTGIPIRTYGQQEANLLPIVSSITKYATMITRAEDVAYEIGKAIHIANSGRKGPVWIDVPLDVQNMRMDLEDLRMFEPEDDTTFSPVQEDIKFIIDSLNSASRPCVLIGSGIRHSGSVEELKKFIEKNRIPLAYCSSAPDTYGRSNELSIGSVGAMGCSRAGNFAVQNSDLLLVLGSRMTSMTTGDFAKFARGAKIVVVDIDKLEHSKCGVRTDRLILADVKLVLNALNEASDLKIDAKDWLNKCLHWKNIFPVTEEHFRCKDKVDLYQLTEVLSKTLPANSQVMTDSGLIELILPNNLELKSGQRLIHPASQGSMGAALPALVGAYFVNKNPVVSVIGDGSVMMNLQELQTISHYKIPAKLFIVNNNAYAIIRKRQKELFASRTIGTDSSNGVSCPDFKKVAEAFGFEYRNIASVNELEAAVAAALAQSGPVLCEVMGLENQAYIHSSYTKNEKGRVVQPPIEDQSPFLDRSLFRNEMIVEPIDL